MKQKRMKLITKLLIYILVFAIGGYFFYKYMPQGFKELVTPSTTAPATTSPASAEPTSPASPEVSPAQ
ncbi:MAG: hypothetical protein II165_00220 [Bacteroidales bacterium]|nr:hypothetical protein [Bacteroidales bacterium]